jgi:RNA polymerase sigma-70 factor (ECF subfamily)
VTDGDLVARARDGDQAAFGELVSRHRTAVYRAAMAALGSRAEADDAAQDAFVMAWRRLASFRGEASFRTWLLSIAWHQAINRRRGLMKWWRRTVPFETVDDAARVPVRADTAQVRLPPPRSALRRVSPQRSEGGKPDPTYERAQGGETVSNRGTNSYVGSAFSRTIERTPEQLASSRELRRDIAVAIRTLTPKLRDTLLLAQSGEYSYEEIGVMVGAPVGTIKWRVAEARRLVKKQLQKAGHVELG